MDRPQYICLLNCITDMSTCDVLVKGDKICNRKEANYKRKYRIRCEFLSLIEKQLDRIQGTA